VAYDSHNPEVVDARAQVDNYIITACISLIAAFVVILTVKKPVGQVAGWTSFCSLFFLVAGLLASLWHKIRHPIRVDAYERQKKSKAEECTDKIYDFYMTYVRTNPDARTELATTNLDGKYSSRFKEVIAAHLQNMSTDMKLIQEQIFHQPLDEKNPRMKYCLDGVARRLRYAGFVLGVILFLTSVFIGINPSEVAKTAVQ
jgi:hypothetical protein